MPQSRRSKKKSGSASESSESPPTIETHDPDQWRPPVEAFPTLSEDQRRTIYVAELSPLDAEILKQKGYTLVNVYSMPRGSPQEDMDAIEAWMQGMSEGTIQPNSEKRRCLELEAHAKGLLVRREMKLDVHAKVEGKSLEALLERFTDHGKTLMPVSEAQLKEAERAALIPGYQKKEKKGE